MSAARPILPLAGAMSPRVASAVAGWRNAAPAIGAWAGEYRDPARPLIWLHGSSAGEIAGGAPVIRELRAALPDLQVLVTHFSPSGLAAAEAIEPDMSTFLPLDSVAEAGRALDAASPTAVVFAKLDVWPGLTRAAAARRIPLGLINGTVRPSSSRLGVLARRLLHPAYGRLDAVGAATKGDARRLAGLGVGRDAISVTGDAAFEEAVARFDASAGAPRLAPRVAGRVRLIAGSTWPEDDHVMLRAIRELRDQGAPLDVVLVPHQPSEQAVRSLIAICAQALVEAPRLWSGGDRDPTAGTLIVDEVGFLAELYREGDLAWVGGGFGDTGLHSVLEPAAAGLPVLFGPRHERFEGTDLLRARAAIEITADTAVDGIGRLVDDEPARRDMGERARAYVDRGRGAAEAGAALVKRLMR